MALSEIGPSRSRVAAVNSVDWVSRSESLDLMDQVAILFLCGLGLVVALTFRDYGIIWDEEWQNIYGKKLLSLYASGFADTSALHYSNLYLYGGLFDLTAAIANLVSPFGEYETRHLLGGFVGVLGMAGTWRLARHVAGPRAGLLALALMAMTPVYYGHMFFNPKDVPFACGMIWSLYWIVRVVEALPRPSLGAVLTLGAVLGMTLATRVGALIAIFYLGCGVLAFTLSRTRRLRDWKIGLASLWIACLKLLPLVPVAYIVMGIGWPWGVLEPLNPLKALWTFSHFGWEGMVEVDGKWVSALHLPWTYLPLFLTIQLPEIFLAGLALAVGLFTLRLWRGNWRLSLRQVPRIGGFGLVILAAIFPLVYFIVFRPNAYHTLRHFLFVLPPLAILAGWGIDRLWRQLERRQMRYGVAMALVFIGSLTVQGIRMADLHPSEYVSYNSLVGGAKGAQGYFELDYWGNSLAEAAELLNEKIKAEGLAATRAKAPYLVKVCGYPLSGGYFLSRNFRVVEDGRVADFFLALTQAGCDKTFQGQEIAKVERAGVVLAVVKDRRMFTRAAPQVAEH
jgi:hypothetical protein